MAGLAVRHCTRGVSASLAPLTAPETPVCAVVDIVTMCCSEHVLGWLTATMLSRTSGPALSQLPTPLFV